MYGAVFSLKKGEKIKNYIEPGSSKPAALSAVRLHKEYRVQFWALYFKWVEGVAAPGPECADWAVLILCPVLFQALPPGSPEKGDSDQPLHFGPCGQHQLHQL